MSYIVISQYLTQRVTFNISPTSQLVHQKKIYYKSSKIIKINSSPSKEVISVIQNSEFYLT